MAGCISELTKQQESLLENYLSKWSKVVLSRKALPKTQSKIDKIIGHVYRITALPQPKLLLLPMKKALAIIAAATDEDLGQGLERIIEVAIVKQIEAQLRGQIEESLWKTLQISLSFMLLNRQSDPLENRVWDILGNAFSTDDWNKIENRLWVEYPPEKDVDASYETEIRLNVCHLSTWVGYCCLFDFCISELDCQYSEDRWQILQQLVSECDYLLPYEQMCIAGYSDSDFDSAYEEISADTLMPYKMAVSY